MAQAISGEREEEEDMVDREDERAWNEGDVRWVYKEYPREAQHSHREGIYRREVRQEICFMRLEEDE